MYCAEQIIVPPDLGDILKAYSKEVIRNNPEDIYEFSSRYFAQFVTKEARISLDQLVMLRERMDTEFPDGQISQEDLYKIAGENGITSGSIDKVLNLGPFEAVLPCGEFLVLLISLEGEDLTHCAQLIFEVYSSTQDKALEPEQFITLFQHLASRDPRVAEIENFGEILSTQLTDMATTKGGIVTFDDFASTEVILAMNSPAEE